MLSAILQENLKKHLLFCEIYTIILIHAFAKCRRGETGRRNRLKICRGRPRIGSIPIDGTNSKDARSQNGVGRLFVLVFLCSSFCVNFWYTFFHTVILCAFYSANFLCFFLREFVLLFEDVFHADLLLAESERAVKAHCGVVSAPDVERHFIVAFGAGIRLHGIPKNMTDACSALGLVHTEVVKIERGVRNHISVIFLSDAECISDKYSIPICCKDWAVCIPQNVAKLRLSVFALSVGKEIGANGSVNMVHLLQKLHDTCKVFFLCA